MGKKLTCVSGYERSDGISVRDHRRRTKDNDSGSFLSDLLSLLGF